MESALRREFALLIIKSRVASALQRVFTRKAISRQPRRAALYRIQVSRRGETLAQKPDYPAMGECYPGTLTLTIITYC